MSADKLNWRPFTMALAGGYKVRDLAALRDGERPVGLSLNKEELDRRRNPLTSEVKNASTMSTTPPNHWTGPDDSQSGRGHQTSRSPPGPEGRGISLPVTTMSRGQ